MDLDYKRYPSSKETPSFAEYEVENSKQKESWH